MRYLSLELLKAKFNIRIHTTVLCLLSTSIISCGGGSSGTPNTSPDGTQTDTSTIPTVLPLNDLPGNTGIFTIDETVTNLGGTSPQNFTSYPSAENNEYLASRQFVDANGVVIEFVGLNSESLNELQIAEGIQIDGFDDSMLSTNGFISVVYPDDYDIQKIVKITTSDVAEVIIYWPGEQLIETLPASRTVDSAIEFYLPEKYKQLVFAMLIDGALDR